MKQAIVKTIRLTAMASLLFGSAAPGHALERGAPAYPIGVDTLYSADFPPISGLFLLAYGLNYQINNIKDGKGKDLFGGFDGRVTGVGLRPLYVWDTTIFGARPVTYAILPFLDRSFSASTLNIPNGPTVPFAAVNPGGSKQSNTGLGDIFVGQVLDWKLGNGISAFVGFEATLPVGDYDKNRFFNIASSNYFTFTPNFGATWRSPDNHHLSFKFQYSTSTRNSQDTPGVLAPGIDLANYQSGDFITLEAAGGVGLTKEWGLDIVGFALVQTTDDKQNSVRLIDSKTKLFGIGPQLRYNFGPGAVAIKFEHEFGARNSPEGNRFWIQAGFPLWVPGAGNAPPPAKPIFTK